MHNTFRIHIAIPRDVSIQRPRCLWTTEKRKHCNKRLDPGDQSWHVS